MPTNSYRFNIIEATPSFVYGRLALDAADFLVDDINSQIDEDDYQQGEIGYNSDEESICLETRKSTINWLSEELTTKTIVESIVSQVNASNFDLYFTYAPDWQYTIYSDKADHYDWHTDEEDPDDPDEDRFIRTVSVSVCLSSDDQYEGGEFFIKDGSEQNVRVFKMRYGDFIVFPSTIEHRVNALRDGQRASLVAWFGYDHPDDEDEEIIAIVPSK